MKDPAIREILKRTELQQYTNNIDKIVEEMKLPVAGARIDMAVINGAFHGYEIKSAVDTLNRLPNQLLAYSNVFDYLTVVTEKRYIEKIKTITPDWVSVAICSDCPDEVEYKVEKEGGINPSKNGFFIAKLLCKEELISVLHKHGIPFYKSDRVWNMCELLSESLDIDALSASVREILKRR